MTTTPIEKMRLGVYFLHCNRAAEVKRRGVGSEWPHLGHGGWWTHLSLFGQPLLDLGWRTQMHWQSWGCEPRGENNPHGTQEVDAHLRIRDAFPESYRTYARAMHKGMELGIEPHAYIGNPWDTHYGASVDEAWAIERAERCMDFFDAVGVRVWMDAVVRLPTPAWHEFASRHYAARSLWGGEGWPDVGDPFLARMSRILNSGTREWLAERKLDSARIKSMHPGWLWAMLGTGFSDKRVLPPDPVAATVLEIRQAQALGCEACMVTSHVVLQAKLTRAKLLALAADLDWPAKAPQAAGGQKK